MAIDLSNVKGISIPQGNIKGISVNGVDVWKKQSEEPSVLLSWEHILWSIANNRYKTDYSVGDLIPLDLGTEGNINMQIAAFDTDNLADNTGKAHISFISKELLATKHRMNPKLEGSAPPYGMGTGSIGGWEISEMRNYLESTIKPMIMPAVRDAIAEVAKSHVAKNASSDDFTQTTYDFVWIPSKEEVMSGGIYGGLYPNTTSRIKYFNGEACFWKLRNSELSASFSAVAKSGSLGKHNSEVEDGVSICFCL